MQYGPNSRSMVRRVMRGLACVLLISLVASTLNSCRPTVATSLTVPSTLERFDHLRLQFSALSQDSARLQRDEYNLNRQLQHDRVTAVRRDSVALKIQARTFSRLAGRAGNVVRSLARGEIDWRVRKYFLLDVRTLLNQWREGRTLVRVADLLWADPLVMDARDVQLLPRVQNRAAWYAWQAVVASRQAARWRAKYTRLFRYPSVPARNTGQ